MSAIEPYTRRMLGSVQPIIVANRAPLVLHQADPYRNTPERLVKGAGGLVTAMTSLAAATDAVWVAIARDASDRTLAERGDPAELTADDGTTVKVAFVEPASQAYDLYYNVISNPLLWFIQHYLWNLAREPIVDETIKQAWVDGYVTVNQLVADRVVAEAERAEKPALVFVQDYQMYCVPGMIRERLESVRIQHFVHIPWPTPQYWTILPKHMRDAIVRGLLGADIIGFQTLRDVRNFLLTCEENLGLTVDQRERTVFFEGRAVWVRNYPISIDPKTFIQHSERPEVHAEEERIEQWRPEAPDPPRRPHRPQQEHRARLPGIRAHARGPPRADRRRALLGVPAAEPPGHRRLPRLSRPRAQHGGAHQPRVQPGRLDADPRRDRRQHGAGDRRVPQLRRAARQSHLRRHEPGRQGGPARATGATGCSCSARTPGSHEELGDHALTVNPFDIDETAEALYFGLMMDLPQRQVRLRKIRDTVMTNDITRWIAHPTPGSARADRVAPVSGAPAGVSG